MQYFKELGHNVVGLDLGIEAINYGQNKGLNLINIDLPDFQTDEKFDLVIYNSVLEHIGDLKAHLNRVREVLVDNGKVFIRVPGIKNLHNNSFHKFDLLNFITLPHIYYFSATSITNIFNKYGFKNLKINEIVFSLFEKANIKDIEFKSDYNEVLKYIKKQDNILKIKIKNILFKMKISLRWILIKTNLLNFVKKLLGKSNV
jgi:predicted TPR repeat methyltransferase